MHISNRQLYRFVCFHTIIIIGLIVSAFINYRLILCPYTLVAPRVMLQWFWRCDDVVICPLLRRRIGLSTGANTQDTMKIIFHVIAIDLQK